MRNCTCTTCCGKYKEWAELKRDFNKETGAALSRISEHTHLQH